MKNIEDRQIKKEKELADLVEEITKSSQYERGYALHMSQQPEGESQEEYKAIWEAAYGKGVKK